MQIESFAKQVFEVYATQAFTSFIFWSLIDTETVLIILSYNMVSCYDVTSSFCHLNTFAEVWSIRAACIFWMLMSPQEMSHCDWLFRVKSKTILKFWIDSAGRIHHHLAVTRDIVTTEFILVFNNIVKIFWPQNFRFWIFMFLKPWGLGWLVPFARVKDIIKVYHLRTAYIFFKGKAVINAIHGPETFGVISIITSKKLNVTFFTLVHDFTEILIFNYYNSN